jgi:malate dehydrogenase (oxaloacetate-decarboxylating)(NADP+)
LREQRLLFLGAGEAGTGIADLFVSMLVADGVSETKARQQCSLIDSKGLVTASRADLAPHKKRYAHEAAATRDLLAAVEALRPTALIGVSGSPSTFTRPVIEALSRIQERPVVFALSNPTSKSECTAEQAYRFSNGRAVFASGSPFPEVVVEGKLFVPGQCNNAYVFPGVGLGVLASGARRVTDAMFAAAAKALAGLVGPADLEVGRVYPSLQRIREVSRDIAVAVAEVAFDAGLADNPRPADLRTHVEGAMYWPVYRSYV